MPRKKKSSLWEVKNGVLTDILGMLKAVSTDYGDPYDALELAFLAASFVGIRILEIDEKRFLEGAAIAYRQVVKEHQNQQRSKRKRTLPFTFVDMSKDRA